MKNVIRLISEPHLFYKKDVLSKASFETLSQSPEPEDGTEPSQTNPGGGKTPPSDN